MARCAAGMAALLSLTFVAGAHAQSGGREELVYEASSPSLVDARELDRLERKRAEAIRTDVEISRELQRLPERQVMDRMGGGPVTWRLWNTY